MFLEARCIAYSYMTNDSRNEHAFIAIFREYHEEAHPPDKAFRFVIHISRGIIGDPTGGRIRGARDEQICKDGWLNRTYVSRGVRGAPAGTAALSPQPPNNVVNYFKAVCANKEKEGFKPQCYQIFPPGLAMEVDTFPKKSWDRSRADHPYWWPPDQKVGVMQPIQPSQVPPSCKLEQETGVTAKFPDPDDEPGEIKLRDDPDEDKFDRALQRAREGKKVKRGTEPKQQRSKKEVTYTRIGRFRVVKRDA